MNGTRKRSTALAAIAILALMSWASPDLVAAEGETAPQLESETDHADRVDMDAFGTAELFTVTAEAGSNRRILTSFDESAWMCIDARKRTFLTENRMTGAVEAGCDYEFTGYEFDAEQATATAVGVVQTEIYEDELEKQNGEWIVVKNGTATPSTADVNLTWQGTGEDWEVRPYVGQLVCLPLPCIPRAAIERFRDAIVSGSIQFNGFGTTAAVPTQHPGTMRYWLP